jgi:nucleotide-binding universal stress UspA family protein
MEGLLQAQATVLSASEINLDELLAMAKPGRYELIVLPIPDSRTLSGILQRAAAPLLFVRGDRQAVGRILLVMRGYASDEQALAWLAPFVGQQASVTLMPLTNGTGLGFSEYYHLETPAGQHLERCLRHLDAEGVSASLKYRQGDAVQQVVEEMAADDYDLLVLAAEAEGDFVGRVIAAVEQRRGNQAGPILVIKPPELPAQPMS